MLVYALKSSSRLEYILEFICEEIFIQPIQLTNDRKFFLNYDGHKINYSQGKISEKEFWISNVDLLFEDNIKDQTIVCFETIGNQAFFQTTSGDYAFDIFAASFYLLSRYEEYLPHVTDKYARYAHTNAVAFRKSFLHLPLINIWLKDFKGALVAVYPELQFRNKPFALLPTYDIDIAWSYRNKGWWRNTGGLFKSFIKLDWNLIKERIEVIIKKKHDPFDSYLWLHTIHKLTGLKANYFFLLAFKQKGNDKNISPLNTELQELIKEHDSIYTSGIHPSWQSGDDEKLLQQEIKQLKSIVGHDIVHSRQHYLRFTLPVTYRKLIGQGIKNDYSMGYGTINGFRASVASSFFWYDLENEMSTSLRVYPFCFMDATAYYELKLSPAEALDQMINFYKVLKNTDGLMITLWHNNFLGTDSGFAGWREVYDRFLMLVTGDDK